MKEFLKRSAYVLGSINMDMVISTPYIPSQGETLTGNNFFLNNGGKGANQAVAIAKQNVPTFLIAAVGNDEFGKMTLDNLKNYGVNIDYVNVIDNINTGVAMIIIENRDNRIILDSGANYKISTSLIDNALKNAKEDDVFVCQLENNEDAVYYGLKQAKNKKMITIFNAAPAKKIDKTIFNYVDYLIVNESECEIISSIKPTSQEEILKAYNIINVKKLIITLGEKGSVLVDEGKTYQISANKVEVVDTTAAGDTYVGVLASQIINNKNIIEGLNYASIASSLTCKMQGAQKSIPTKNDVEKYINSKEKGLS